MSNLAHRFRRQFAARVLVAAHDGAVRYLVGEILFKGGPSQILGAIIVANTIPVRSLLTLGSWSVKCLTDEDVYQTGCVLPVEGDMHPAIAMMTGEGA